MLHEYLQKLEKWCNGIIGVSACHLPSGNVVEYNANQPFLLCSTYKIPIAISLLQKVEKNELSLDQQITVHEYELRPGSISTINQLNYTTPVNISLLNLMQFMLQESCNTATDIILKLIGGPSAVMECLKRANINDLRVDRYTLEVLANWDGFIHLIPKNHHCTLSEYQSFDKKISLAEKHSAQNIFKSDNRDQGTPAALNNMLLKIVTHELVNRSHSELLLKIMQRCKIGANRIMGLLPPLTRTAHKTGTLEVYTHDVGVIYLSESQQEKIIISVFTQLEDKCQNMAERAIAEVSRTLYDYFIFGS